MKAISFKTQKPASPDEWVRNAASETSAAAPEPGPMKRFTFDVPLDLHSRVKSECAKRQLKMADMLREFLEREFPAPAS